jgi:hypothetical protein
VGRKRVDAVTRETSGRADSLNDAQLLLEKAVRLNPRLAFAHFELGNLYAERKQDSNAIARFQEAIRLDPNSEMAHYKLAQIYRDLNELELAEHSHRVQVERTIGGDVKSLSLTVETRGIWRSSGRELREVEGCVDVDLALTPATNTLPHEFGSECWQKFPMPAEQMNQYGCDCNIEHVISGRAHSKG